MTDDATLSEFDGSAEANADAEAVSNGDGASPASDALEGATAWDDVGPTYAWGEYTCRRCDRRTERVWRSDDGPVCPDCKRW